MAGRRVLQWILVGWMSHAASKIQSLVQLDLNSNELHLDGGREISWGLSKENPTTTDVYRRFIACWNSSRRSRLLQASHYPIGTIRVYQTHLEDALAWQQHQQWLNAEWEYRFIHSNSRRKVQSNKLVLQWGWRASLNLAWSLWSSMSWRMRRSGGCMRNLAVC